MTFKKAMVLVGKGNSGKTTALTNLIDELRHRYGFQELFQKKTGRSDTPDFISVLKCGDFIIGITTRGDSAEQLKYPFQLFQKYNCSYIVCAAHETENMFNALEKQIEQIEYTYAFHFWNKSNAQINEKINKSKIELLQKLLREVEQS